MLKAKENFPHLQLRVCVNGKVHDCSFVQNNFYWNSSFHDSDRSFYGSKSIIFSPIRLREFFMKHRSSSSQSFGHCSRWGKGWYRFHSPSKVSASLKVRVNGWKLVNRLQWEMRMLIRASLQCFDIKERSLKQVNLIKLYEIDNSKQLIFQK